MEKHNSVWKRSYNTPHHFYPRNDLKINELLLITEVFYQVGFIICLWYPSIQRQKIYKSAKSSKEFILIFKSWIPGWAVKGKKIDGQKMVIIVTYVEVFSLSK